MKGIRTIVFDLGGVLLDLNIKAFRQAFVDLGVVDVNACFLDGKMKDLFRGYELGYITTDDFIEKVQKECPVGTTSDQVRNAWMSMAEDISDDKLELILELKKKYNVFLLSNTNEMHWQQVKENCFEKKGKKADDYFDRIYLSYEMHDYKPSTSIFNQMIEDAGIRAGETFFVDDRQENVDGALAAGLQAICVETSVQVGEHEFRKPEPYWVKYLPYRIH